jgi:hypothetical protein
MRAPGTVPNGGSGGFDIVGCVGHSAWGLRDGASLTREEQLVFSFRRSHRRCRGCSSVGRALAWHARGHEFDSRQLHRINEQF